MLSRKKFMQILGPRNKFTLKYLHFIQKHKDCCMPISSNKEKSLIYAQSQIFTHSVLMAKEEGLSFLGYAT